MRTFFTVLLATFIVIVGCALILSLATRPGVLATSSGVSALYPAAGPQFGWHPILNNTIELQPTSWQTWTLRVQQNGRYRLAVNAAGPVNADIPAANFDESHNCTLLNTVSGSSECELGSGPFVVKVTDARDPASATVSALAGALTHSSRLMENSMSPNRVTLELFRWKCIQNCP